MTLRGATGLAPNGVSNFDLWRTVTEIRQTFDPDLFGNAHSATHSEPPDLVTLLCSE